MKAFFGKIGAAMKAHKVITVIVAVVTALVIVFSCLGAFTFNRFSNGILPTDEDLAKVTKYEHVVIFGVDGAGGYFGETDTPNFDRIYKNGSVSYTGMSQFPTISAQNWTSMIHGVRYQKHGIDNSTSGDSLYTDTKYPSFFKVYAERHPDATFASICNWSNINKGIIEHGISGMHMDDAGCATYFPGAKTDADVDRKVAELAVEYIQNNEPTILFMQFDSVDGAGHEGTSKGYGAPLFDEALKTVDGLIGQVYDAYVQKGWGDNTLFITVSDHGHEKNQLGGGHGGNNPSVRNVTIAVAGGLGNVIAGTPGKFVTQDLAAIVMYALGEKQYETWEARVPTNMFVGLE